VTTANHYQFDKRVVMTLDAGGTNFVFSAMQANEDIVEPVCLPSNGNNLEKCLETIIDGFNQILSKLTIKPVAISFAFPGPTDYGRGIIGDLNNLRAFKGGVALGPFLFHKFNLPVYINNDGDLFAYGEALAGLLPYVNQQLRETGSTRQFHNLIGVTLGTGFGGGVVLNHQLLRGDNGAAAEIWNMRNKKYDTFIEESASIRAVKRVYNQLSGKTDDAITPRDIYEIATGTQAGNTQAALSAFEELGELVGDALANIATVIDGIVVIGGGLSGAHPLFMPRLIAEMNTPFQSLSGQPVDRLETKVYNLEEATAFEHFLKGAAKKIPVPGTDLFIDYDPHKRIGVGISRLGTSKAVSVGAYCYALNELDR